MAELNHCHRDFLAHEAENISCLALLASLQIPLPYGAWDPNSNLPRTGGFLPCFLSEEVAGIWSLRGVAVGHTGDQQSHWEEEDEDGPQGQGTSGPSKWSGIEHWDGPAGGGHSWGAG